MIPSLHIFDSTLYLFESQVVLDLLALIVMAEVRLAQEFTR